MILVLFKYKICRLVKYIYYKNKFKETYYSRDQFWSLLRGITHRQFEAFCCYLYSEFGYDAQITRATHDGGKDVILKRNGITTYVECKHYGSKSTVGREICQKLLGSCMVDGADSAIVFTTGNINSNAIECERKTGMLTIVSFNDIFNMFNDLDINARSRVLAKTINYR